VNSRLFVGTLAHARTAPTPHRFRYPVVLWALDLDELPALARAIPWFGHDRVRPVAFHERDHLDGGPEPLKRRVLRLLEAHGCAAGVERVILLTAARVLHHAFNPISLYWAYAADGAVRAVVAEVNNTFGERHVYVLRDLAERDGLLSPAAEVPKAFHVSPYFDMRGEYRFRLADIRRSLDVRIDLVRDGAVALAARLTGEARPLDGATLARTLARHPFDALLTVPRIVAQALWLRFRRRLPWHEKPAPSSPATRVVARPGPLARVARAGVLSALARVREHRLEVALPEGGALVLGDPDAATHARLEVRDPAFFTRVARGGDIGLGEAFEAGAWTSPDPGAVLMLLARERRRLERWHPPDALARPWNAAFGALRDATRAGSRRNARDHYDLGNDFFGLFLDPSMTYSAAAWRAPGATLEQAQAAKLDMVLAKTRTGPGARILEIGSGWGSFALRAAAAGAEVTGLTLSREQWTLARERAAAAGLADRARFELRDYRDVRGAWEAVVSIEMIEAVGHRHLPDFFRAVDRALAPGGRAVLQAITIADRRYEAYRRRVDWIQRYIFPGGLCPSFAALTAAMARGSTLVIEDVESLREDYARTLVAWRENLAARHERARALGLPERFLRRWEYYLRYCEAGFRLGELDVAQIVLRRPEVP
jgi:cyclopropane-fatty-acyl-phospholipid synthase